MIEQVTRNSFIDAFKMSGSYKDNFTYAGLNALFDYLESYEEDTGEKIELDIVAISCDYNEYNDFAELQENYKDIETMEELEEQTIIIRIPESEGFIIQAF